MLGNHFPLPPVMKIISIVASVFLLGGAGVAAAVNPPLPPLAGARDFRVVRDVEYLTAPGRPGKLDLYLPVFGENDPPAALVIWIHNPGWGETTQSAPDVCGTLAGQGYVCASVSYGEATEERINLVKCRNVVRFLRAHAADYHLDPARIALGGGSLSGYYALMIGLTGDDPSWQQSVAYPGVSAAVRAILDFYGPTSPRPGEGRISHSPPDYVTPSSPPVLILQGLDDPEVRPEESALLDRRLFAKQVPHRTYFLKGMGHAFGLSIWSSGRPMKHDVRPLVLDFLRQFLDPASGEGKK